MLKSLIHIVAGFLVLYLMVNSSQMTVVNLSQQFSRLPFAEQAMAVRGVPFGSSAPLAEEDRLLTGKTTQPKHLPAVVPAVQVKSDKTPGKMISESSQPIGKAIFYALSLVKKIAKRGLGNDGLWVCEFRLAQSYVERNVPLAAFWDKTISTWEENLQIAVVLARVMIDEPGIVFSDDICEAIVHYMLALERDESTDPKRFLDDLQYYALETTRAKRLLGNVQHLFAGRAA